jgi:hypothetical protein
VTAAAINVLDAYQWVFVFCGFNDNYRIMLFRHPHIQVAIAASKPLTDRFVYLGNVVPNFIQISDWDSSRVSVSAM